MTKEEATVIVEDHLRHLDRTSYQSIADAFRSLFFHMGQEKAQAVADEREACARIAQATNDVYNLGFCIAADIRARK